LTGVAHFKELFLLYQAWTFLNISITLLNVSSASFMPFLFNIRLYFIIIATQCTFFIVSQGPLVAT
jgi:hypothetical protein